MVLVRCSVQPCSVVLKRASSCVGPTVSAGCFVMAVDSDLCNWSISCVCTDAWFLAKFIGFVYCSSAQSRVIASVHKRCALSCRVPVADKWLVIWSTSANKMDELLPSCLLFSRLRPSAYWAQLSSWRRFGHFTGSLLYCNICCLLWSLRWFALCDLGIDYQNFLRCYCQSASRFLKWPKWCNHCKDH